MIALDASVVIAFLDSGDAHHERSERFVRDALDAGFLVHALTLAEVLVGPARAGRAEEVASGLRSVGFTVASQHEDESLLLADWRARTGLKLPDCCVLHVASANSCPLATFDRRLREAATAARIRDAFTEGAET